MKKTLLILSLSLACAFPIKAQSDATWEETIQFIKKYSSHFKVNNGDCESFSHVDPLFDFKITGNFMSFVRSKGKGNGNEQSIKIDLTKLKRVSENNYYLKQGQKIYCEGLTVVLSGAYVETKFLGSNVKFVRSFTFTIRDGEMRNRMYKAFQHLVKLATEKREAERKASGDKF